MKTLAKVLESMLSKPATPSWNAEVIVLKPQIGPERSWGWDPAAEL